MSADPLAARPVAEKPRLKADNLVGFIAVHLVAALAFVPCFFSWTGVAVFIAGVYVFGVLGINLGFHRLLTHRSFACPLWLEHALAVFGACSLQFSPAHWVAVHRRHHHHADEEMDPHSPLKNFLWALRLAAGAPAGHARKGEDRALCARPDARPALRLARSAEELDEGRPLVLAGVLYCRTFGRAAERISARRFLSVRREPVHLGRRGAHRVCLALPGRSTPSPTCGAIAITRRRTTAGTTR